MFPAITLFISLNYSLAVGSAVSALNSGAALQLLLDCFGIGAKERIPPPLPGQLRIDVVGKQCDDRVIEFVDGVNGIGLQKPNDVCPVRFGRWNVDGIS